MSLHLKTSYLTILGALSFSAAMSCSKGNYRSSVSAQSVEREELDSAGGQDLSESFSLAFLDHTGLQFNRIEGTDQDDPIDGTSQSDLIRGHSGNDTIRGLQGADHINGNQGMDTVNGNQGNDVVRGGKDNDHVYGGSDNDWVYGDLGDDQVFGNLGDDHLLGGEGNDFLDGGDGNDTYYFKIGDGNDRIHDTGGGIDRILCLGFPRNSAVIGTNGEDVSIQFPSGDSIVIENRSDIENLDCLGTEGSFADNGAPQRDDILGTGSPSTPSDNPPSENAENLEPKSTLPSNNDDVIDGTSSSDAISAQGGDDTVRGLDGNDVINGNQGRDTLNGNSGNDLVMGGQDDDHVMGGQGDDFVFGNLGNDRVEGNLGNDILNGNEGNDNLDGGEGDDIYHFVLGSGTDIFEDTGGGNDTVVCLGFEFIGGSISNSGADKIIRFDSGDRLTLKNASQFERIHCPILPAGLAPLDGTATGETLDGTQASEHIRGLDGNDTIRGNDGNDIVNGNSGNDTVNGNSGNDHVAGGQGDDTVMGGQGDDYVVGALGNDRVEGNLGNDQLTGGEGTDTLDGGEGNDVYEILPGHGVTTINDSGGGFDQLHCANFNAQAERTSSGSSLTLRYPSGETIIIQNPGSMEVIACP